MSRAGATAVARWRIALLYLWRHGRLPRLSPPRLFTEHVQYRKLHERDPRFVSLADKVGVKEHVAHLLGPAWITPTLWAGVDLPDQLIWPLPLAIKSRHGCNQHRFVRGPGDDWPTIRRTAARWMQRRYGYWLDEWAYSEVPRGLFVEPFIGQAGVLPIDYKLFVFGGRVAFIQVHLERETAHRWLVFDRSWRQRTPGVGAPPPPLSLDRMIEAAELLGQDFTFVRIDFYEIDGEPRFGEMTFYPGSGLYRLDPPELDSEMGALWSAAAARA